MHAEAFKVYSEKRAQLEAAAAGFSQPGPQPTTQPFVPPSAPQPQPPSNPFNASQQQQYLAIQAVVPEFQAQATEFRYAGREQNDQLKKADEKKKTLRQQRSEKAHQGPQPSIQFSADVWYHNGGGSKAVQVSQRLRSRSRLLHGHLTQPLSQLPRLARISDPHPANTPCSWDGLVAKLASHVWGVLRNAYPGYDFNT